MDKWPNLFVVGTPKAGTTSLYHYLKQIPQIFMSPIKEPNYFSQNYVPGYLLFDHKRIKKSIPKIADAEEYLSLFHGVKDETIIGESSVSYLSIPEVPKLIHQRVPQAHIIISLRDPVERMFSGYHMHRKFNRTNPIFYEEIKYQMDTFDDNIYPRMLRNGLYYDDVKNYLETFGKKQVKILIFEDWIKNPRKTMKEICEFLGVKNTLDNFVTEIHHKYMPKSIPRGRLGRFLIQKGIESKKIKNILPLSKRQFIGNRIFGMEIEKKMTITERKMLIDFFQDDVKKLEYLLDCKFPWPNFKTD